MTQAPLLQRKYDQKVDKQSSEEQISRKEPLVMTNESLFRLVLQSRYLLSGFKVILIVGIIASDTHLFNSIDDYNEQTIIKIRLGFLSILFHLFQFLFGIHYFMQR